MKIRSIFIFMIHHFQLKDVTFLLVIILSYRNTSPCFVIVITLLACYLFSDTLFTLQFHICINIFDYMFIVQCKCLTLHSEIQFEFRQFGIFFFMFLIRSYIPWIQSIQRSITLSNEMECSHQSLNNISISLQ